MKCNYCGAELNEDVDYCEVCGASVLKEVSYDDYRGYQKENNSQFNEKEKKPKFNGKKIFICSAVLIVVFCSLAGTLFALDKSGVIQIFNNKINQSQINQQETYEEKARKLVNAKYNELDLGMSYDQVVHILRDKQGTFVDKENNQTKVYYWGYYLNEKENQDKEIIIIAAKFINEKLTKKIITEKLMDVYNKI